MAKPLDFGSADSSIVRQADLSSALNITNAGGTVVGAPDFNAAGMLPKPLSTDGGAKFDMSAFAALLVLGGQISVWVDREVVARPDTLDGVFDNGSVGVVAPATQYIMATTSVGGAELRMNYGSGGGKQVQFTDGVTINANIFDLATLPSSVKLTLSWDSPNSKLSWWLEDDLIEEAALTTITEAFFDSVKVGMSHVDGLSSTIGRFQRVLISTQIPSLSVGDSVTLAGDSFMAVSGFDYNEITLSAFNDSLFGVLIRREVSKLRSERIVGDNAAVSGKVVETGGGNTLDSNKADVIAGNPKLVICNVGINDVTGRTLTQMQGYFREDYQAFVDYLLANEVEEVVLNEVISPWGDSTKVDVTQQDTFDRVAFANTAIRQIADSDERVSVVSLFEEFGGDVFTPTAKRVAYVRGMLNDFATTSARNDLHPSSFGYGLMADQAWDVIGSVLGYFGATPSRVTVSAGTLRINGQLVPTPNVLYVAPTGGPTDSPNNGPLGNVSAVGDDLVVNGYTITSPAALYVSPDGKLTDIPNGPSIANFLA